MYTIDQLMRELRDETGDEMTKQASLAQNNETLDILGSLSERINSDAVTNDVVKHASVAATVFSKTAAQNFKANVLTDAFAVKVANLLFDKLAGETATDVVSDIEANIVAAPAVNPMNAAVISATEALPPEVQKIRNETGNLINATGVVEQAVIDNGSPTHAEVAKQAAAMGVDMNVLDKLAEEYLSRI